MFDKNTSVVTIDLLFNLLLCFIALFFLAYVMITDAKEEMNTMNKSQYLITMRWTADIDIDLWLMLPDGRKIWYHNRDEPPAHLDLDVTHYRRYHRSDDTWYVSKVNEEIITIRGIMPGEYVVNAHRFNYYIHGDDREYDDSGIISEDPQSENTPAPVVVEIIVQDVQNKKIVYAGIKELSVQEREVHFVRFTVEEYMSHSSRRGVTTSIKKHRTKEVYTDRPVYILESAGMGR